MVCNGQVLGPPKLRDPLLSVFGHRWMAWMESIEGQVLALALGDPDSDRDGDSDAENHSRDATETIRCVH
jgi:hypothetical protein